jgi:PAS domain S-box-containing protein
LYGFYPENGTPSFEEMVQRIHPEDRARVVETAARANCEGNDFEAHFRPVLPDGTAKYVYGVAHPVFKPSGDVGEFVGILIDVTERRLAEQATRLLAAVVELSHDAIVSKNLDGVITSWNKGAERLFGYTAEEAVGENITLIIPPDHRDEERTIIERLTRGERVDYFETVRMRKDGSLFDKRFSMRLRLPPPRRVHRGQAIANRFWRLSLLRKSAGRRHARGRHH